MTVLYPIFCTADIPVKVLDELLNQANEWEYVDGEMLCFVTTKDISKLKKVSQPPMASFESPFLGMDVESINDFVKTHCHGTGLCSKLFAVLDNKTPEEKTCLL
ncbi:MAG: hypothetical protein M1830_002714, partial [Pleopsidium flavum]